MCTRAWWPAQGMEWCGGWQELSMDSSWQASNSMLSSLDFFNLIKNHRMVFKRRMVPNYFINGWNGGVGLSSEPESPVRNHGWEDRLQASHYLLTSKPGHSWGIPKFTAALQDEFPATDSHFPHRCPVGCLPFFPLLCLLSLLLVPSGFGWRPGCVRRKGDGTDVPVTPSWLLTWSIPGFSLLAWTLF